MTTNKPEVRRYTPAYSVDSVMRGHLFMEECERGAWVPLEDHEALQAECERLDRESQNLSDQLGRCDRERLKAMAECEKLRNLLVEIERGCSRRDMPSEKTISSWADAIEAAGVRVKP